MILVSLETTVQAQIGIDWQPKQGQFGQYPYVTFHIAKNLFDDRH